MLIFTMRVQQETFDVAGDYHYYRSYCLRNYCLHRFVAYVLDDKLGNVGTVSSLDVGASTTLTKDFTIPCWIQSE